jgi:hypothetical protein
MISTRGLGLLAGVALFALAGAVDVQAQCRPNSSDVGGFVTRYSIPSGTDLEALLEDPTALENRVYEERIDGENRTAAVADYHVVYPVSFRDLRRVLLDLENQEEVISSVSDSRVECSALDQWPHYYRQRLITEFGFLFFSAQYDNRIHVFVESTGGRSELRQKFVLAEALDDKMLRSRGSWYLESVRVNGRPATYLRYYYENAFAESPAGLQFALNRFSEGEVRKTLDSLYNEAR